MPFVDFAALKQRVSIEQTSTLLGLNTKPTGSQLRAACPSCKEGGERAIVITPEKGLFYCFPGKKGGDAIELVCHVRGLSQKDAAALMSGEKPQGTSSVQNSSVPVPQNEKGVLKPLDYLQPEHEAVQGLGVSKGTALAFGSGFSPRGIMRGRFAIPVHDRSGTLLAYCGRTVKDESPQLLFPNGFNPASAIFNAHKVTKGELYLVRDPLQVLQAFESGIENVVAFLTDGICPQQFEELSSLMDERKCDIAQLY
jgi:DNA primase